MLYLVTSNLCIKGLNINILGRFYSFNFKNQDFQPTLKIYDETKVCSFLYYSLFKNCWISQSQNWLIFRCFTAYYGLKYI